MRKPGHRRHAPARYGPVPLVATAAQELHPALSPDGRWLAYSSNESGTFEVYVRPFPETSSAKWQVSTAGGARAVVDQERPNAVLHQRPERDGRRRDPGGSDLHRWGSSAPLFKVAQFTRIGPIPSYSLAPDDKHFLMVREGESTQQSELIVAENWLETLRGK